MKEQLFIGIGADKSKSDVIKEYLEKGWQLVHFNTAVFGPHHQHIVMYALFEREQK